MVLTYKKAGVDVRAIDSSLSAVGKRVASTHRLGPGKVLHGFGHYAGIVKMRGGPQLAFHADGVGTKALVAASLKKYGTVGIDCIAMNVNDIACMGAVPLAFVDYIAANKNDRRALSQIAAGLARGAKKADVPIVGGETAVMPGLVAGREFAFDLAGAVVGYVPGRPIDGRAVRKGDAVIGVESSGLHSNGYTLARKALKGVSYSRRVGRQSLGEALLEPTRIYSRAALEAAAKCEIHGMAHITGGSFAKLSRLKRAGYELDSMPPPPPIMELIASRGVKETEMYRTFNMGVGFCAVAPEGEARRIRSVFSKHRMRSWVVGSVSGKTGVRVGRLKVA